MLSLRAFTRSLPRSTYRIASYTTRASLRPALHRPIGFNVRQQQPLKALFSTTFSRRDDAGQELAAKLEKEIELESENNEQTTDSDSNVQTFLSQNDFWEIEDREGEQDVVLKRKYDDETITVSFSIADFNAPSMLPEDESDEAYMDEEEAEGINQQSGGGNTKGSTTQGRTSAGNIKVAPEDSIAPADREELRNDEDDYDSQQAFPANVHVLIQRPDTSKGSLRVHLITDNGRFVVQGVMHLPSTSSNPVDILRQPADSLYTGPPFGQLDEEVQNMLEQYLDARGINTALALFIPDYIDVKEQKEYLGWLGRVKGFVAE